MLLRHNKVSFVLLVVCLSTCIEYISTNSVQPSQTSTASFYGATHPLHNLSSSSLHVALQFTISQGTILSAPTQQGSTLALALNNHSLSVGLHGPQGLTESLVALTINLSEASPAWISVVLFVSEDTLSLTLPDAKVNYTLLQGLNFTGDVNLGGDPSRNSPTSNYVGCLSNLTVNSQTVQFPTSSRGGYSLGCCVPPRRIPSRGNFTQFLWEDISVRVRAGMLDEGTNLTITDSNLRVVFPNNLIGYDVSYWLRSDLESYIVFDVVTGPSRGRFTRGSSPATVDRFYYTDLLSSSNLTEIVYHHSSHEGSTDSVQLRGSFVCEDGGESPWSETLTLQFSIVERDYRPHIAQQSPLYLAIGTRIVITPQIITVEDRETTNASKIMYSVEYVGSVSCTPCHSEPRGQIEWTDDPGTKIRYFSQNDINKGKIAFQHLPHKQSESETVKIGFRVRDSSTALGNTIHPTLSVHPHPGSIHFNPPVTSCIFMEVGHQNILSPDFLKTVTDFEDQNPTVIYDILNLPALGKLEVYESKIHRWSPLDNIITHGDSAPSEVGYFTQDEINNGRVRYTHTGPNETDIDTIRFRLRSTMYVQEAEHQFCFHVLTEENLEEPELLVHTRTVELPEGGSISIGPQFLNVSLSEKDALYSQFGVGVGTDIRIQQLEPLLVLETAPTVGWIEVKGQTITTGESFTLEDLQGGEVYYNHPGNELHSDTFRVYVFATVEVPLIKQPPQSKVITIEVAIAPVNNHEPVYTSNSEILVTEGSYVVVTADNIMLEDDDLPGDSLYIHLRKPRNNKPLEITTGNFAFHSSPDERINGFTMDDVTSGRVVFNHHLNESAELFFLQTLKMSDGQHPIIPKPQIRVTTIPHTLTAELANPASCFSHLDLLDSSFVQLDRDQLLFSMTDRHGEDSNLIAMVSVTVGNSPQHGQLLMAVSGSQSPVSQFTVSDLEMNRIRYQFTSSQSSHIREDELTLNFKYGHSFVGPVRIQICIDPIPAPDFILIQPAQVTQNGLSKLNSTHLWANNTRGERGETIIYEIIEFPKHGSIMKSRQSTPVVNFTQADVDKGLMGYNRPREVEEFSDNVTLRVCTVVGVCSDPMVLVLEVQVIDLMLVNTGFSVAEGDTYTLTLEDLSATAPEGYSHIEFLVVRHPWYGNLTFTRREDPPQYLPSSFTQDAIRLKRVAYHSNLAYEELEDEFVVDVFTEKYKENGNQTGTGTEYKKLTTTVQIQILPVNDHIPQVIRAPSENEPLVVAKEGTIQIHSAILSSHDEDSDVDDLDLIYSTVFGFPSEGYLYLDSDPGDASKGIDRWTERDIREGRLYYKTTVARHERDGRDTIILRVDESEELISEVREINTAEIQIRIIDIIFEERPGLIEFSVHEGGTQNITSNVLSYFAENDYNRPDDDDIEYKIVDLTRNGVLKLDGVPLNMGGKFSQQRIVDGALSYTHDHSNTFEDSFTFKLGDRSGRESADLFTFRITVRVTDDDPPMVVVRNPVLVVVSSTVLIKQDTINITDHDTVVPTDTISSDLVYCQVVREPTAGIIQRKLLDNTWRRVQAGHTFTKYDIDNQFVRYESLVAGYRDSFQFTVSDEEQNSEDKVHTVEIFLLPVTVSLTLTPLTVDEDSYAPLESEHLVVNHEYLKNVSGTIFIRRLPTRGYLEDAVTGETNITSFTTSQLLNQSVVYRHNGGEEQEDSMEIQYRSNDPQGLNRESDVLKFIIDIIANNDQVPVLYPGRRLVLELWAREVKVLDQRYLNASDGDTPISQLRYTIAISISNDGYIAYSDDLKHSISTFTQAEVNDGNISFVHVSTQDGVIQYNVSDGDFITPGSLSFHADPLALECDKEDNPWAPISVGQQQEVVLSRNNLGCNTSSDNGQQQRRIMYHVDSVRHGEFLVEGDSELVFTKRELEAGLVSYRHTDMDQWEAVDVVRLNIETDFDTTIEREVNITIHLPQADSVPAIRNNLRVTEGQVACLNLTTLDARNVRYQSWLAAGERGRPQLADLDIHFVLSRLPEYGSLVVDGQTLASPRSYFNHSDLASSKVCYHHDDSEVTSDSFQFQLHIVSPGFSDRFQETATMHVDITPVNDIRPILETTDPRVQLVKGFPYTLTPDDLSITDGDTDPEGVLIFLDSLPDNALIYRGKELLSRGGNFSQGHINNGEVSLTPVSPLPVESSSFTFHFTDEGVVSAESEQVQLAVSVVDHKLNVLGTRLVTYQQNENEARITSKFLSSQTNSDHSFTIFTIDKSPTDGTIMRETSHGHPLKVVSQFTQTDIDMGKVWYIPIEGSRRHRDSFVVTVSNRELTVSSVEVSVRVLVWGHVKADTEVEFFEEQEEFSYQLPVDIIQLDSHGAPPSIELIEEPKYGHLELKITPTKRAARSVRETRQFHYDDLQRGWVYYVWDSQVSFDEVVKDNFTLLVNISTLRPGEAFVELSIMPPSTPTLPPTILSSRPQTPPINPPSSSQMPVSETESGFPLFSLIPILGVIGLLLMIIVITFVCCMVKQKNIRKTLHIPVHVPSPMPVSSPALSPTHHMGPQFTFDPNSQEPSSEDDVSGFSEDGELPPMRSPSLSQGYSYSPPHPTYTGPSPAYIVHRSLPPGHRPRVLSNVSITLSGRHSSLSQVSMEEPSRSYSHSLPRPHPPEIAVPIPMRPASQVAYHPVNGESGYNSCIPTSDNSRQHSLANVSYEEEVDLPCGAFPSALDDEDCGTTLKPVLGTDPDLGHGVPEVELLDLSDPNVQRRFNKSTHPVLKKQEYWF